ncbi:plasmid partitioning protein RepB [Ruegeria sp. EL01]|jgi:ParB family chromosome partitioning protein|uniref:plasmid partitioning protein RepB n=1 Tax=Ruegeria sp. EL01 TaxID=2107578 RepID=UPI000EA81674|nr:plasmid partitioning protein RepB [Ruegeria sp. EL01]
MARKVLNAYEAVKKGQGEAIKAEIPVMRAFESSLQAIRDLDPGLIDDWGPADRLEEDVTAVTLEDDGSFEVLKNSIKEQGQQVPALVRPSKSKPGRFEVIYGRRRVKACADLEISVRANVQEMDDETALMAKGLENAARRGLSFYEKALFAAEILSQGKTTKKVGEVLGVSRNAVSQLSRASKVVPRSVGVKIGPAPASGRPKWFQLADAFEAGKLTEKHALVTLSKLEHLTSDQRLDQLIKETLKRGAAPRVNQERSPIPGVTVKSGQGINIVVKKGAFANWLDEHLDEVLKKAHGEFEATSRKE